MKRILLLLFTLSTFLEIQAQIQSDSISTQIRFGVISIKGDTIIPFEYDDMMPPFNKKSLLGVKKDEKWGAIDTLGNIVIPIIYSKRLDFKNRYIIATNALKKIIILDYNGKSLAVTDYEYAYSLGNDFLGVKSKSTDTCTRVIDIFGKTVLPPIYEKIRYCSNNYVTVKESNSFGVIDLKTLDFSMPMDSSRRLNRDGIYINYSKDREESLYTPQGNKVTFKAYSHIETLSDSTAYVEQENRHGVIKLDGSDTEIIPLSNYNIHPFHSGYFSVENIFYKIALVDSLGKFISDFIYDDVVEVGFNPYYYKVELNDLFGVIDNMGKEIYPIIDSSAYIEDAIFPLSEKLFRVSKELDDEHMYGLVDNENNIVLPISYDEIENSTNYSHSTGSHTSVSYLMALPHNWVLVNKNGKVTVLDISSKKQIIPFVDRINGMVSPKKMIVGVSN